ncbi:MAG: GH116 family glycosyl-hydrolase, partial [Candidatus Hinthialibacter sp.]
MEFDRRDVLKILTAAPFVGLFGAKRTADARSSRDERELAHIWRMFEEPFLSEIAFPLGGIGTGSFSLGGRGNLRDWEIYNKPDKGRTLDNTFFGVWCKEDDSPGRAFVLESAIRPPYRGGFGLNRGELSGMPRLQKARFLGSYPFARIEFSDDRLPLEISLEVFNPFIPLNDKDSGLPVGIFYWQIKNTGKKPVDLTLMASLQNIVGNQTNNFGQNINEYIDAGGYRGLMMRSKKFEPKDERFGTMALITLHNDVTYSCRWERGGWFDSLSLFWNDFSDDGRLNPADPSDPSPDRQTDTGSLGALVRLAPEEEATIPFLITWHFPNRHNYWNGEKQVQGKYVGNYYATQFADAWDVGRYVTGNLQRLEMETRLFHEALFKSTVPDVVLDAVSSQASILRTNTCFRDQEGKFFAFEGCSDNSGCCPLNCTHVWNYEQTLAFLFPALERTMRDTDFLYNTDENGKMAFRTLIPLGLARWQFHAAADGQMGCIIKLYREWQISGDYVFLKKMWPQAKKALEFAWKDWDPDKNGVMEGQQHNTYDIEFYGPNPMMGAIYLTALRAAEKM